MCQELWFRTLFSQQKKYKAYDSSKRFVVAQFSNTVRRIDSCKIVNHICPELAERFEF